MSQFLTYFQNCFIPLIPILLWNVIFMKVLPPPFQKKIFWQNIPSYIRIPENLLRIVVFLCPLFMKLSVSEPHQWLGLILYLFGMCLYFWSWIMQINFAKSTWSKSIWGFTAPAYSTIIWFVGIGLIGSTLFVNIPYHYSVYLAISLLFVIFHTSHAFMVFKRL
jgi:hypothetical protein